MTTPVTRRLDRTGRQVTTLGLGGRIRVLDDSGGAAESITLAADPSAA
jgi:hypothetical protein